MLKNLLITLGIVLSTFTLTSVQQGRLQGKVYEKDNREPVAFANIILENGGTVVGGATSDFDGNYVINPIPPGKYDLKATFVGYNPVVVKGITISGNQITFYDIVMLSTSIDLQTVEIIEYKVPLISKDQTTSGASVTSSPTVVLRGPPWVASKSSATWARVLWMAGAMMCDGGSSASWMMYSPRSVSITW